MLRKNLVSRTEAFLKEKFDGSAYLCSRPHAKAYRLEHTYRVANIGREIALKEGFDETGMVIACLLHDVSYCEDFGENGWIEHGRRAAQIARPFLEELGLPKDSIHEICYGIAIHVDEKADFPGEMTPFALTVGEADSIDRFDAYRIHETLSHDRFLEKSFEEQFEYVQGKLSRLHDRMNERFSTKTADEMWKSRLAFYIAFYDRLARQLLSSCGITDLAY